MTELDASRPDSGASSSVRLGGIEIDRVTHAVSVDGRPVTLTAREYELLEYLAGRRGHLLTRAELISEVWGAEYNGGPRTVDIHVSRLRRKLGEALPLVTLRRSGYRVSGG